MILSEEDAKLFFELLWGLQLYVHRAKGFRPVARTIPQLVKIPLRRRQQSRKAMWEDPTLIDAYLSENPDDLDESKMAIVRKWKQPLQDKFFIDRYLKAYTVLHSKDAIYGVVSLSREIEDLLAELRPPIYVTMVLLPFKGRIVYDDVIEYTNIHLGGFIKRELHEKYMIAKQNGQIITSLEPDLAPHLALKRAPRKNKPARDWGEELSGISAQTAKIRGGNSIQSAAYGALRASAELAQSVAKEPQDLEEIKRALGKARSALTRTANAVSRAERGRDAG